MAADRGLGGCGIGSVDIDLFTKMTGLEFHMEGPVGQFALGRGARRDAAVKCGSDFGYQLRRVFTHKQTCSVAHGGICDSAPEVV